jgi:hypothetical protein
MFPKMDTKLSSVRTATLNKLVFAFKTKYILVLKKIEKNKFAYVGLQANDVSIRSRQLMN